jgi:glycosyltransferase involved in cell wall biosynthesis
MKRIKILYGLEAFGGGALKHLTYLVTMLNKEMFEITIVVSNLRKEHADDALKKIKESGVDLIFIPMSKKINIIKDFCALFQIVSILKTGRYDIAHAHSSKAGGVLRIAAFMVGVRNVLYTPHCFYFQGKSGLKKFIYVSLEKLLAKITSGIIVSDSEKREIIKNRVVGADKIVNINNAIDFNDYQQTLEISETLKEFSIPEGKFIVGAIGRLTPQKDWETFVYCANEVLRKYPETIFIITGEGELENEINKLIFKLGLEKNILLTGYIKPIYKIFAIIDVFVNTSLWEGLPYVFLEAMQYKKPIIATDTGTEVVIEHDKSGFITPVKDYHAIAKKIEELIEDKHKAIKMGKEGNDILTQKYSFELFIKKHEELYCNMFTGSSCL